LVARLVVWHVPRIGAVYITFLVFLGVLTGMLLFLFPLVSRQLTQLISSVPELLERLQTVIKGLPEAFPEFIDSDQVDIWLGLISGQIGDYGRSLLETTVTQLPSLVGWLIYLVLVPISVFFFLKDGSLIMRWFSALLPADRPLLNQVGAEMSVQIANYVRGKVIEIFIVGAVSYSSFAFLGLDYAALLGFLVGVSVLIPFVGAAIVTIPVMLVGFLQWGWNVDLFTLFIVYSIIQALALVWNDMWPYIRHTNLSAIFEM
jgi:putative permease